MHIIICLQADSADKLLSTFPKSKRSFELALFYLSLQIYVQFLPSFRPEGTMYMVYTHALVYRCVYVASPAVFLLSSKLSLQKFCLSKILTCTLPLR